MAYYSQDGDTLSPPGRAARRLDDPEDSHLVGDLEHCVLAQRPLMPVAECLVPQWAPRVLVLGPTLAFVRLRHQSVM